MRRPMAKSRRRETLEPGLLERFLCDRELGSTSIEPKQESYPS
jgi:hypothetical protein